MALHQINTQTADRANAEIVFVALLTTAIVGVGAVSVTLGTEITADTSETMDQPTFEVADRGDLELTYADGPILNNKEATKAIRLYDGDDAHVVYNATDEGDLQPGDTLINRSEAVAHGISADSTVEVVVERDDGESEVVDELYIPDENLLGNTGAATNGSINVSADRVNASVAL